jgi:hypothetical protein
MAGREFGPPPSVVQEFDITWRNWLYLVFKKIYKRQFDLFFQMTSSIGLDGGGTRSMTDGVIGVSPVALASDSKLEGRFFSMVIPEDYVAGTDVLFLITVINSTTQTGVKSLVTNMDVLITGIGDNALDPSTQIQIIDLFPSGAVAGLYIDLAVLTIPAASIGDKRVIQFEIQRDGGDVSDTVVGDVGYKELVFRYTGFINHE